MKGVNPRLSTRGALAILAAATWLHADSKKAAEDQHIELLRGLSAEWATVKTQLPRTKKPLDFDSSGAWDKQKWEDIGREVGPAAKPGELIQVTHVSIEKDAIVLELTTARKLRDIGTTACRWDWEGKRGPSAIPPPTSPPTAHI